MPHTAPDCVQERGCIFVSTVCFVSNGLRQKGPNWFYGGRLTSDFEVLLLAQAGFLLDALEQPIFGRHSPSGAASREVNTLAALLDVEAIWVLARCIDLGRALLGTNTHAIVRDAPFDVVMLGDRPDS